MAKVPVAVRLERGVSRQVIYESAIVGFLAGVCDGVPDLVVTPSAGERREQQSAAAREIEQGRAAFAAALSRRQAAMNADKARAAKR